LISIHCELGTACQQTLNKPLQSDVAGSVIIIIIIITNLIVVFTTENGSTT